MKLIKGIGARLLMQRNSLVIAAVAESRTQLRHEKQTVAGPPVFPCDARLIRRRCSRWQLVEGLNAIRQSELRDWLLRWREFGPQLQLLEPCA